MIICLANQSYKVALSVLPYSSLWLWCDYTHSSRLSYFLRLGIFLCRIMRSIARIRAQSRCQTSCVHFRSFTTVFSIMLYLSCTDAWYTTAYCVLMSRFFHPVQTTTLDQILQAVWPIILSIICAYNRDLCTKWFLAFQTAAVLVHIGIPYCAI